MCVGIIIIIINKNNNKTIMIMEGDYEDKFNCHYLNEYCFESL